MVGTHGPQVITDLHVKRHSKLYSIGSTQSSPTPLNHRPRNKRTNPLNQIRIIHTLGFDSIKKPFLAECSPYARHALEIRAEYREAIIAKDMIEPCGGQVDFYEGESHSVETGGC